MTAGKRRRHRTVDRKKRKTLLQAGVLVGGILLLTGITLAVTGVLGRHPATAGASPSATTQIAGNTGASAATPAASVGTSDPGTAQTAASPGKAAATASASPAPAEAASATPKPAKESEYVSAQQPVKPARPVGENMTLTEALEEDGTPAGGDVSGNGEPEAEEPEASVDPQDEQQMAIAMWMEMSIEANRDKIDAADLADFRAIIAKLDQLRIYGWANEGFTGNEQRLLIAHLHERLDDTGYQRAKTLFKQYRFVLDTL